MRAWIVALALTGFATVTAAQQPDESAESSDAAEAPTTVVDDLSQAEIDAALARAEGMMDETREVKEFTDTTPLPADLPLALPSDF